MAKALNFFDVGAHWQHQNLGVRVFVHHVVEGDPPRFWLSEYGDSIEEYDFLSKYRLANPYTAEELLREFNPFPGKLDRWNWLLAGGAFAS